MIKMGKTIVIKNNILWIDTDWKTHSIVFNMVNGKSLYVKINHNIKLEDVIDEIYEEHMK